MNAKQRRKAKVTDGTRLKVASTNLTWSGLAIPAGTLGTVFISNKHSPEGEERTSRYRYIRFDGFPEIQPNTFYFGIGGTAEQTYLPNWAEIAEEVPANV